MSRKHLVGDEDIVFALYDGTDGLDFDNDSLADVDFLP